MTMAKVFLFATLVTAASTTTHFIQPLYPRHLQPRRYNEQNVQRRNIDYHSDVNANYPLNHNIQENPEAYHRHTSDCQQIQDLNRFGHPNFNRQEDIKAENNYKTSTRPGKQNYPIDQVNEDLAYTNIKPKVNRQGNSENIKETHSSHPRSRNKPVLVTPRIPDLSEDQERNVKTNVNPVKHNISETNHMSDGNQGVNDFSEEIKWIWGSDDTSESSNTVAETSTLDLDNRVALSGDSCPKGMAKIAGKCVMQI